MSMKRMRMKSPTKGQTTLWRKHRIPFEKACFFWLVLASKPGMEGAEFLQNTTRETADGLLNCEGDSPRT